MASRAAVRTRSGASSGALRLAFLAALPPGVSPGLLPGVQIDLWVGFMVSSSWSAAHTAGQRQVLGDGTEHGCREEEEGAEQEHAAEEQ